METNTEKQMWEIFFQNNHYGYGKIDRRKKETKFLLSKHSEKELVNILLKKHERSWYHYIHKDYEHINWTELREIVKIMRRSRNTNYLKIFIQGNRHIYLASPIYEHRDYNKSIFCINTPHNWEICKKTNDIILKKK